MKKLIIYRNFLIALISVFIGLAILNVNVTEDNGGVPYKHSLTAMNGKTLWVKDEKYGIKFKFAGADVFLNYPSKLGSKAMVYEVLKDSKHKDVSVLYKQTIPRQGFDGDVYHNVWQIVIDGRVIQSYENAEKNWRNNELWLWVIIPLFLIGGPYIGWQTWRKMSL